MLDCFLVADDPNSAVRLEDCLVIAPASAPFFTGRIGRVASVTSKFTQSCCHLQLGATVQPVSRCLLVVKRAIPLFHVGMKKLQRWNHLKASETLRVFNERGGEILVWSVTGDHLLVISATCPLLSCSDVSDCHRPFSIMCGALCSDNFLAQSQLVSCTSCDLVCVSSDEKGISLRLSL